MKVGLKLRQVIFYMSADSIGSSVHALMHRLAWVFAGRLCDKYHFLMRWIIVSYIKIQYCTNTCFKMLIADGTISCCDLNLDL